MKILFITHQFPYPTTTGNAHIAYHQIVGLSKRHVVDVLSFSDRRVTDFGGLYRCCASIEILQRSRPISLLKMLLAVAASRPLYVSYFRHKNMAMAVERRLAEGAYDAAVFQLSIMGQYLPKAYQGVSIWSLEDPTVIKELRQIPWHPWYRKIAAYDKIIRYGKYERELARRFTRILMINENDASDYATYLGSSNLDWVPYAIDSDYFSPAADIPRQEGMIVITGNMYHPPNIVAVDWFCDNVFPLIQKRFPPAKLWLVGARPTAAIRRRSRDNDVTVTGSVPDIRLYQRRAKVSVCPVQLRVGTQTKVLEAMSCGTPVVTTSAGNHGVAAVTGRDLHVADDAESFANKVVSLLRGEQWSELSANGRKYVVDNFSWPTSVGRLERIIGESVLKNNVQH